MTAIVHSDIPLLTRQNCVTDDVEDDEQTDLTALMEVSHKLNLPTRRPSTVQWKQIIEFRKSMGLYSTDLSNINEEKSITPRMSRKEIQLLEQKQFPRKNNENSEEVFNHDSDNLQDLTKSSNEEKLDTEKLPKTINFLEMGGVVAEDINRNLIPTSQSNSIMVTNDDGRKPRKDVSAFPLYDTESEDDDEETSNLSDMAVRCRNITRVLGKIRRDLILMSSEDNNLARKLLDMRIDINRIRVQQSCDAHADMLDDVTYEMEEEDMLPEFIKAYDLPNRPPGFLLSAFSPLRNIGISRMNLNRRRFSIR